MDAWKPGISVKQILLAIQVRGLAGARVTCAGAAVRGPRGALQRRCTRVRGLNAQELLHEPNPGSVANWQAYDLWKKQGVVAYEKKMREQAKKYASGD